MKQSLSTKKIVLNGLMIAVVFLTTYFTRFPGPIPPGYINLGDAAIIITALLLGRKSGFIAGAIGSCLADIVAGAFIFAPATLIIKGIEGYLIGRIADFEGGRQPGEPKRITAVIIGAAVMVVGYFAAEAVVLGLFDSTLGLMAAITELPLNLVQGGVSAIIGYAISVFLIKSKVHRYMIE